MLWNYYYSTFIRACMSIKHECVFVILYVHRLKHWFVMAIIFFRHSISSIQHHFCSLLLFFVQALCRSPSSMTTDNDNKLTCTQNDKPKILLSFDVVFDFPAFFYFYFFFLAWFCLCRLIRVHCSLIGWFVVYSFDARLIVNSNQPPPFTISCGNKI